MHCPFCHTEDTKVTDSRLVSSGNQIRRRRECLKCGERFTTYERAELLMPHIIKSKGTLQPFDEDKLRAGITRALEKRPVKSEAIEAMIDRIKTRLRQTGEREVSAHTLGEWVMDGLRKLDEVAYVRFASVYRKFQDVNAFHEEIKRLQEQPVLTHPLMQDEH